MKKAIPKKQKNKNKKIPSKPQKKTNKIKYIKFLPSFYKKICTLFILMVIFIFEINKIPLEQYQANVLPEIKSYETNFTLDQQIFYEFRQINSENRLIEENSNFKKSFNPDVSVVFTMYNQAHCIYKGLRSVQNQSIKNIEIIIVDDCSEDNSTDVIKEYQKEDPRIILISHDTNEGEIKSRTDGIRKAKGKYITIIDGDDALNHKDVLKNCFFIAHKAKLDVVEFKSFVQREDKPPAVAYIYNKKYFSHIIHQPELRNKFIFRRENEYKLYNVMIWAKLIKNEVFQKALNYIGREYTDDYINEGEDVIMIVGIFHIAKSYYITKEIGYYYTYEGKYNRFPKTKIGKCKINNKLKKFGHFKVSKFLVNKNNKNDKEKHMIINFMKKVALDEKLLQIKFENRHYKILFNIYDKMLEWNCWTNEQREYIMKQKNVVMNNYEKKNN